MGPKTIRFPTFFKISVPEPFIPHTANNPNFCLFFQFKGCSSTWKPEKSTKTGISLQCKPCADVKALRYEDVCSLSDITHSFTQLHVILNTAVQFSGEQTFSSSVRCLCVYSWFNKRVETNAEDCWAFRMVFHTQAVFGIEYLLTVYTYCTGYTAYCNSMQKCTIQC